MPQTISAHTPLLSATCLHAALFPVFSGLEVPEYALCPVAGQPSVLVDLPLSPQECRACLAEMRGLDAESLSQQLRLAVESVNRTALPAHEAAALADFAGKPNDEMPLQARLRLAHSRLLMLWVQEERLLDIAELSRRCARSEQKLAALLDNEASEAEQTAGPDSDTMQLLPKWEFVLEQLSWFLPENAVLCVTHPSLAERLRESGRLAPADNGLPAARFRLSELARRPGMKDGDYLFILP